MEYRVTPINMINVLLLLTLVSGDTLGANFGSDNSGKCTYEFTVDSPADVKCGPDSQADKRNAINQHLDADTARKVLLSVTKLLNHQNLVEDVGTTQRQVRHLEDEISAQRHLYETIVGQLADIRSQLDMLTSGVNGDRSSELFPEFTGVTNIYTGT